MKISIINGSPKGKKSASQMIINSMRDSFARIDDANSQGKLEICELLANKDKPQCEISDIFDSDALVLVFPLYVDGIPGHLLGFLAKLEASSEKFTRADGKPIKVYAVSNCGFYEGEQANVALDIVRNWSNKFGLCYCGGIGIGGGGALQAFENMKAGRGPRAPIDNKLSCLVDSIISGNSLEKNTYISIGMPRGLYKFGSHSGWRRSVKANGLKPKDLNRQL